jgi:NAD(P)-dependent dehydrogenase (short-subunit alcohol dehydrogenase family)
LASLTPSHARSAGVPGGGEFAGRVVLVTGAGRGIGQACARLLADAGASLVVAARNRESAERSATELTATGADIIAVHGDLGVHGVAEAHVNSALQQYGRLDALINFAGLFHRESALQHDHDRFDEVIRTNLHGSFYMACAAARAMHSGSTIVLLSSMWANRGGLGRAAYCAAKAGVEALTSVLNAEWSPRGIGVYCVAPAWVATEKNRELIAAGKIDLAQLEAVASTRALLNPIEVAQLCLVLARGDHPMLTGTVLRLDGGLTKWIAGV